MMSNIRRLVAGCVAMAALLLNAVPALADLAPNNASPYLLSVPGSYSYSHSFNSQLGSFMDAFVFTIDPASFNTTATTIELGQIFGIDNLSAALYQGNGFGGTKLEGWSSPVSSAPVEYTMLNTMSLGTGTYTLGIKGNVIGSAGGTYSGVLNLASPVPEPSRGMALLSGLVLLGFMFRRTLRDDM